MIRNVTISNEKALLIGRWTSRIGNIVFDYVNSLSIINIPKAGAIILAIYQSSEILVSIIFNLIGGVMADDKNKKKIIIITDLLSGTIAIILSFFVVSEYIVYAMIFSNIFLSIINAYNSPVYKSIVREVVKKERIERFNAWSNGGIAIVSVVSPLFGMFFVKYFGIQEALIFNGVTFYLSAFSEMFLKSLIDSKNQSSSKRISKDIKAGLLYLISQAKIFRIVILASLINFFVSGYNLSVPYTNIYLNSIDSNIFSKILIVEAIGGVIGAILISKLKIDKNIKIIRILIILVGFSLITIPYIIMTNNVGLILIPFLSSSIAMSMFNIQFMSTIQIETDEKYLGRIFSIIFTISAILMPIGSFIFSILIGIFNIYNFTVVGGGILVTSFISVFFLK